MSNDFLASLQSEIERLRDEMSNDPRAIKLRELTRVLSLYDEPTRAREATTEEALSGSRIRRRTSPQTAKIIAEVRAMLPSISGPVPTREIMSHLIDLGIEIPGESPLNNLSAMLSNSGEFKPHGRSGWTLNSDEPEDSRDTSDRAVEDLI